MKKLFAPVLLVSAVLLSMLAISCGGSSTVPQEDVVKSHSKIEDWQIREMQCRSNVSCLYLKHERRGKFYDDVLSLYEAINWQYRQEDGDRWDTSCEAYVKRIGDCEDFAALFLRHIQEYGYDARIRIVQYTEDERLAYVIVYGPDEMICSVSYLGLSRGKEIDKPLIAEYDERFIYQ